MYDQTIETGMILKSQWSRKQDQDCDYFEVVRRTPTHVLLREIILSEDFDEAVTDDFGQPRPRRQCYLGSAFRRKVYHFHGREYVLGNDNRDKAFICNGTPRRFAGLTKTVEAPVFTLTY